jgi:hypothetical protein
MLNPKLAVKSRYNLAKNMTSEPNPRFSSFRLLPQGAIALAIITGQIKPSELGA